VSGFYSVDIVVGISAAQIREGAFSITPQVGGYWFENKENLEHSLTIGMGGGYNITKI